MQWPVGPLCSTYLQSLPASQVLAVPAALCIHGTLLETPGPRWQKLQQCWGALKELKVLHLYQSWQITSSWTLLTHSKDIQPGAKMKSWLRFGNPQRFHPTQIPKDWHLKQETRVLSLANRREILQESCVYLRANREMGATEGKRSWCHHEYQLEIALDFSSTGAESECYFRISLRNYLGELSIIMLSKMIPVAHAGHKVC